jgi:cysteine desulfurase
MEAMLPWLSAADPGRVHAEGRMARVALEDARDQVAELFGTRSRQVVFTSGATESINAAVHGALARAATGLAAAGGPVVVGPAVEHSAVRDASTARAASVLGTPVDSTGRADVDALLAAIGPATALVHCQWANHEVGTLQPVAEVVSACRERGVLVHVDAASAAGHVPIDFDALGADLLSLCAHKLGGPRGAGAMLVRRGLRVPPMVVGGAQERDRRGGLEDVPALVGFGAAAQELCSGVGLGAEAVRAAAQVDRLRAAALAISGVTAFGPLAAAGRVPHILCLGVEGVEAEAVLLGLDQAGVAAHSGSACSSEALEPSPVLEAMGVPAERSLRLSVGWSTTDEDIGRACSALPAVIGRLRSLRA